jgi:multiple sugar transport system permease protein
MSEAATTPASTAATKRRPDPKLRAERRLAWMLCAPAALVMLAVAAYPVINAVILSLQEYDLRFPNLAQWTGFDNYVTVLRSPVWWHAVGNTFLIAAVSLVVELVLGMGIAIVMHRALVARGLVRSTILIPYGIVTVVAALAWNFAWTPGIGFITRWFGITDAPLTHHWAAIGIIILVEVWKTTPFMALLLLSGLVQVPEELMEAARVDGASAWQRFFRITLPLVKSAILVALLFRMLEAMRIFDSIFVLTRGSFDTNSVSIVVYNQLFQSLNLGLGSAVSVLVFVLTAIVVATFLLGFGTSAPGLEDKR